MPRTKPQLAKLTRPRLHKAVARERLFARLDAAREHKSAICVVGPPGAGKTTLVASWLDARGIKGIWYQVDPGDADLATFFYYLGEAAKTFSRKNQRPLPLLTPEYLPDVAGFSRRFFRELFTRLPEGATVVLDNYQEVAADPTFHSLIAFAVDEVPSGLTLVIASRRDPPDCYARLMANDNVALLDWEDLKLTFEEARAVGAGRVRLSDSQIAELHEKSGGWTAGLVLLLERWRRGGDLQSTTVSESLREVFNYFTGQIFDQMPAQSQDELLRLSYLPRMTARTAENLTGATTASLLLEDLHRRHLFTDRRSTEQRVYQFHALFHAFLQHRAQLTFNPDQDADITRRAAQILDTDDHSAEAFQLYLRCGDVPAAVAIVLRQAMRLIAQGRWRVVVEWIDALPKEVVESNCWLLHWLGTAQTPVGPKEARPILEVSFALAAREGDVLCQIQAAAGIIQTYMLEYTRFRPMDFWIDALKDALAKVTSFPSADAELRALSALLIALSFRKPDDPALGLCADRVFELVQSGADLNLRTLAAAYLVAYGTRTGPLEIAQRTQPLLQRLIKESDLSALAIGWGWFVIAFFQLNVGNESACREAVAEGDRIGREEGLSAVSRFAAVVGAHVEMDAGNLAAAQAWSNRLDEVIVPGLAYDRALSNTIKAFLAAMKGDPIKASVLAQEAVLLFDEAGVHHLRCVTRSQLARALMMQSKCDEAERIAREALQLAMAARAEWVELDVRATLAAIALERGDNESLRENLRVVFELLEQTSYLAAFSKHREMAAKLCGRALEFGIPPVRVRDVVRRFGLCAPSAHLETWPWPVRIFTLGQFRVLIDDQPLVFSRKTPKKPISLLKVLIAFGGRDVAVDRIVDMVWADEEGDSGYQACWLSLHRLRKLLGTADVVLLADGRMSLNAKLVWTDVRAFEHATLSNQSELQESRETDGALSLYRGDFLAGEPDGLWAVPARERLRGKFVHHLERHGQRLEDANLWDEGVSWYLRGIDADPLAEVFYQGLMRCHRAQGRMAEAMSAYRRLKQTLSITLGIAPSPATEAVARELLVNS